MIFFSWINPEKITQELPICLPFKTDLRREKGGDGCTVSMNQLNLDTCNNLDLELINYVLFYHFLFHLNCYFKVYLVSLSLPSWIFKLHSVLNEAVTARGDDKGCPRLDAMFDHHVCCHSTCMQSHLQC